jgi:two-component system response regulator RegA
MTTAQVEWEHIHRVLLGHSGNISATAQALGMHRRSLQRNLEKYSPSKNWQVKIKSLKTTIRSPL